MRTSILSYFDDGENKHGADHTVLEDDSGAYSYDAIRIQALNIALGLRRRSMKVGQCLVVVFLPKSANVVMVDIGVLMSGNIFSNVDVKMPQDRLKRLIQNLQADLVVTTSDCMDLLVEAGVKHESILLLEQIVELQSCEEEHELIKSRLANVLDTDPACIINTSGSTGTPKSVVLSHRSIIDFIDWVLDTFDFKSTDSFGSISPLFFDIYLLELFVGLSTGCKLILFPDGIASFPAKIVEFLVSKEITSIFWVPTIMVNIANLGLAEQLIGSQLRRVFFAGEVFPTKQLNVWRRALPEAQFVNLYGPIEISVDCTFYILDREFSDDEAIPIGRPCRNTEILILNDDDARVKPGEVGELCVRGSSLALGYYNNPSQTAEAFVQNPLNRSYHELIYRTGDLVRYDKPDELYFVGRKDFQIKHQGYRIELLEIETAINALSYVTNSCVLYNSTSKEITAFVEGVQQVNASSLRRDLTSSIPKYMIPTKIHSLESMPMNANGKIDRNRLGEMLLIL